jgi:hypothetical protein
MKSCQPRASIVARQGFATGAYATSAKEKAIACSSMAARGRSGQNNLRANGGGGRDHPSVTGDGEAIHRARAGGDLRRCAKE